MKITIILFPGTNRERDVAWAASSVIGADVRFVFHKEATLEPTDLVILPGGFSFGDYLRSGAIAALSPVMRAVHAHATRGGHVLGICNGFQMLTECNLLPGALARNAGLRFVSNDCFIAAQRNDTPFTGRLDAGKPLRSVLAHGDGNFVSDAATLDRLEGEGRIAFRYCDEQGRVDETANPNGSARGIAGVFSRNLRVLGLMPHLENCVDPALGPVDGRAFFESMLALAA